MTLSVRLSRARGRPLAPMPPMPPVTHEQMHQRTRGEQQRRQVGQDVRAMLGQQEGRGDDREQHEYLPGPSGQPTIVSLTFAVHGDLAWLTCCGDFCPPRRL